VRHSITDAHINAIWLFTDYSGPMLCVSRYYDLKHLVVRPKTS